MKQAISLDAIKAALSYDPETGTFTWSSKSPRNPYAGKKAGTVARNGYVRIGVLGTQHYAHRLAWLLSYGDWPLHAIDHINGDKTDNRLANLRDVPQHVNLRNQHQARRWSKTGHLGVTARPDGKTFQARIMVNGRSKSLGVFRSAEDASAAYQAEKNRLDPLTRSDH